MEKRILLNRIKTPDGTILTSYHRHDYKTYIDKSRLTFSVDGGTAYLKRSVGFSPVFTLLEKEITDYFKNRGIIYDPLSGRFIDKDYNYCDTDIDQDGYRHVYLNGKNYKAHRLVFILSGRDDVEEVEHINGIRSDNRWINLRPCTKSQNQTNSEPRDISTKSSNKHTKTELSDLYDELSVEIPVKQEPDHDLVRNTLYWGTRGPNGDQPLKWKLLKDLDTDHIQAIIDDGYKYVEKYMKAELKYREENAE